MDLELNLTNGFMLMPPTKRAVIQIASNERVGYDVSKSQPVNATTDLNTTRMNSTNSTEVSYFHGVDEDLLKIEIAVQATILYMTLFGNGIVLLVLRLRRQKLTRMQWFIAHLAFADIFVGFFNILPQLISDVTIVFHGDDFTCRFIKYFQVIAMYASSYVLVMAAIDRYLSICHPLTSQTLSPKRVHLMIALAWLISFLCALPQVFIFSLQAVGPDQYDCLATFEPDWGMQAYITWVFVANYVIPFLLLAFCYGRICHVVWMSVAAKESAAYSSMRNGCTESSRPIKMRISFHRRRDNTNSTLTSLDRHDASAVTASDSKKPRGHQRGVSKSKMKTIKLTLTVVLCYLFCWAPFFVVQMWSAFDDDSGIEHPVTVICMLLASLNSCTNPWIYLAFSGRTCQRNHANRNTSRSWGPSTHVTSGGDSHEFKTRSSFIDLSHARMNARSSSPRFSEMNKLNHSKC
ncbi:unnamed protein product [Lymnaea stagnalis]|uniref:G-protein coupled receptors family 1 profile domain-containing protein n=1 Tax=Lymnaea stagnalis TaxID=6523 RepID=A0AAV2H647_LYMST